MSDQELNLSDQEFEAALRSLSPRAIRLDPAEAAFQAGQRSVRAQLRRWRAATGTLLLFAVGSWLLPKQPSSVRDTRNRVLAATTASRQAEPISDQSMIKLQNAMWESGVDGLSPVSLAPVKLLNIQANNPSEAGE